MRARLAVVLPLIAAAVVAPARASEVTFVTPGSYGVVDLGDRVAYRLAGDGCAEASVRARLSGPDGTVDGPAVTGCVGVVQVPWETDLGLDPDGLDDVRLVAGASELPLRLKRFQAERATVLGGTAAVSPVADDPFGGRAALDVSGDGATVYLGVHDLRGIGSIALRISATDSRLCVTDYYCRAGRAVARAGSSGGPLLAVWELNATTAARPWQRIVSEPLRVHPAAPVEVVLTFLPLPCTACGPGPFARVNYVELIGGGVAEPYAFPPDPPGAISLFDGTSTAAWRTAGCCPFVIEPDGSMRSVGGYGLFWYGARTFDDYALRLEFKVDSPDTNSGIFVRFRDPGNSPTAASGDGYEVQVQDYGQAYPGSSDLSQTGAIYSFRAAERIPTRAIGEWNTVEVTVDGHEYVVAINGRVVNRFTGSRRLNGYIGVQAHDPSGTVWYRHIRVVPL